MTNLTQVASILRTTEKNAPVRILNMKLGTVCSRCGGSGNYSFNQTDGTRCFGCRGVGNVLPRTDAQWIATVEAATIAAADGTLDAYIARKAAQARCKGGMDRAFAAWHKMDEMNGYGKNWRSLAGKPNTDPTIVRNKVGNDLVDALRALDKREKTDWIEYDRVLTAGLAGIAEITAELERVKGAA